MVAQFPAKGKVSAQDVLPHDLAMETSVLGGLLLDPHAMGRVVKFLEVPAFFMSAHQVIYQACLEIYKEYGKTDFLMVKTYLEEHGLLDRVGGIDKLTYLLDQTLSSVNIDIHAKVVVLKYQQRQAIAVGGDIENLAKAYLPEGKNPIKRLLEQLEETVHQLTRGKFRGEVNDDEETRKAKELAEEIKQIELTCDNGVVKEFKKATLAKKYKISRKTIESIYLKILLEQENQPSVTLDEFLETNSGQCNQWFLQGILPKGSVTLLHAPGGVGKTRLAYNLYKSIITGTDWNGFPVTAASRKALIVQTDESPGDMVRALESSGYTKDLPVRVKTAWTIDNINGLRKEILNHGSEVVIIDSLTTVSKSSIFSENDVLYATPILELKKIAEETGCSIFLVHHSNKDGGVRGSTAILNSVDQVFKLARPSEGSEATCEDRILTIEKSRSRRPAKFLFKINFDSETHKYHYEFLGEETQQPDELEGIKFQVVDLLTKNKNHPLSNQEIADTLGANPNSVRGATYKLWLDGIIQKDKLDKVGNPFVYYLPWEGEDNSVVEKPFEKIPTEYKGTDQRIKEIFNRSQSAHLILNNNDGFGTVLLETNGGIKQTTEVLIDNLILDLQPTQPQKPRNKNIDTGLKIPVTYKGNDHVINDQWVKAEQVYLIAYNDDETATLVFEMEEGELTTEVPLTDLDD